MSLIQTFLPLADFSEAASTLDVKRLHKQTVETYQIMLQLLQLRPVKELKVGGRDPKKDLETVGYETPEPRFNKDGSVRVPGWGNHPMIRMWRGNEYALLRYQHACCRELYTRPTASGKPRSRRTETLTNWAFEHARMRGFEPVFEYPEWLGRADLHASHRGSLLFKAPEWYEQFGWTEAPAYDYVWPR